MGNREWVVIKRNIAICNDCDNTMALWKNIRTIEYRVICDFCPNEYEPEDRVVE